MKKLAKIAALATAAMVAGSVFADITFESKTKWTTVGGTFGGSVAPGGITNYTKVNILTDKIDAGVKLVGTSSDYVVVPYENDDDTFGGYQFYGWTPSTTSCYIEYRPIEQLTIGLNDGIFLTGSYLPVYDDVLNSGNMGGNFALTVRPVKGFRIAAAVDSAKVGANGYADVNFGADYNAGAWAIGAAWQDAFNTAGDGITRIAVAGSFNMIPNTAINAGYATYDDSIITGKNIITLGVINTSVKNLLVLFDYAMSTEKCTAADFQAESYIQYTINKSVDVALVAIYDADHLWLDAADKTVNTLILIPQVDYFFDAHNKVTVGTQFVIDNTDGSVIWGIPVTYKLWF